MSLRRAAQVSGVRCAASAADAVKGAEIVVSAVTAASSLEAAQSIKTHLTGNPLFLDINSVSPGRKQDAAKLLGDEARYLDVAVLAPIHPARHQTRCSADPTVKRPSRCSPRSACAPHRRS
jgi:3-hydroxyisobutyrate dehydrogenase-like beta-hydroxyacid dehydrogenase